MKLTVEENRFVKSIENNDWTPVKNLKGYKKTLSDAAVKTMPKDRRMNIRIAKKDLDGLKAKALVQGIPVQSLVSSILHKYVIGKLKEKDA